MTDAYDPAHPARDLKTHATAARLLSGRDFLRLWNSPDRPRLTREEAADFAEDLEVIRREAGVIPGGDIDPSS
jgi:hypothetical protein